MNRLTLAAIGLATVLGGPARADQEIPPEKLPAAVSQAAAPWTRECLEVSWSAGDDLYMAFCYRKSTKMDDIAVVGIIGTASKEESRRPRAPKRGFTIWDELLFAKDGRWLSTETIVSERDCKILGKSVCRALKRIDAWYQKETGRPARGSIRIHRAPDKATFHVPGDYGVNLFDVEGKFIEFQSYKD